MPECDTVCRIFTRVEHESLPEAVVSDLIDAIPVLGDISTFMRSQNLQTERARDLKLGLLAFDFVADLLPFGDILELIVPANTLSYLIDRLRNI